MLDKDMLFNIQKYTVIQSEPISCFLEHALHWNSAQSETIDMQRAYLLWIHDTIMIQVLIDHEFCRLRTLVLGTEGLDLVVLHGAGGLCHGVYRNQVNYCGHKHKQSQDGCRDDNYQVKLPALCPMLMRDNDDKDSHQCCEGNDGHGDHKCLCLPWVIL